MLRLSDKFQLVASLFVTHAVRVATMVIMARLIGPEDYGLFALVLATQAVVGALGNFGIPITLVQIRDFPEKDVVRTAITLAVVLESLYATATLVGGVVLAARHDDSRYWIVAIPVAATSMLAQIYGIQIALLNRRLQFRRQSLQNVLFVVIQATTGIVFASLGWGVFALAIQGLVAQLISNLVAMRRPAREDRGRFSMPIAKRFFRMGAGIGASMYLNGAQDAVTAFSINRVAGQAMLGVWNRANQIQQLLATSLMASFQSVAYPHFCRAVDNPERMRSVFVRTANIQMLFAVFGGAWLFACGPLAARVGLGPQWDAVGPLLRITAFAVPAGAIYALSFNVCFAYGRTAAVTVSSGAKLLLFLSMPLWAKLGGVPAMAAVWASGQYLGSLIAFQWAVRQVKPPLRDIALTTVALLIIGVVSAAAMMLVGSRIEAPTVSWMVVNLLAMSAVGAGIYALLVALTQRDLLKVTLEMVRAPRQAAPPAQQM